MEIVVLLVGGLLIGIPLVAVIALVRTERTRKLLDELSWEYHDKIADLNGEIANLRRELAQVSQRAGQPSTVSSTAPDAETRDTGRAPETVVAPFEAPKSRPIPDQPPAVAKPVVQLPLDSQRVAPPPPIASLQQADTAPMAPQIKPETEKVVQSPVPTVTVPQTLASQAVSSGQSEAKTGSVPPPRLNIPSSPGPYNTGQPQYASVRTAAPRVPLYAAAPPRKSFAERLRATLPLEELLGMNLFAKIGIILLVLGFALLGRVALVSMGPGERVALIYAAAAAMLGGGIWLEGRERYRLVGRTGIGGGWALLFFTTYAMHHVQAMTVMSSNTLNCVLMLAVAVAMVAHTLRYQSQLVTGLAFLLAFSTVALSQDSVYALAAGVILAVGIVAIALRMGWYELEVFGILASYANHFYWLYRLYPDGLAGHPFPQFWPSAIILILYWAIFRVSYVARGIRVPRDETISTIAALANSVLLLAVMKFQSTRPELAFYALLGLGAAEFFFGQLPATRRRRPAFILLTVLGTMLMFGAVPFKFSGNNIALFWMIAAEVLLIAGIVQLEVVFRRLGLLAGAFTGLLIVYEAWGIIEFRQRSDAPRIEDGILLLTCSALFYLNSQFIRLKWQALFKAVDAWLATSQSYLGCITAFLGVWCLFTGDWTAIGWAALMLGAALGRRYFDDKHLLAQGWMLFASAWLCAVAVNCHLSELYPHRVTTRLITLPILALAFYVTAWALSRGKDLSNYYLRPLALWAGSSLLVILAYVDVAQSWIAPVWVALAVALSLIGRRIRLADLTYQEHVLAVAGVAQLVAVNMDAQSAIARYFPLIGCAVALYAISRFSTLQLAPYRRPAAWLHTWTATALLAGLAWHESPQPWLAAIWALFALALAVVDRIFDVEGLPYQAHVLALFAVLRAISLNLYTQDKWHGIDLRLIRVSILVAVLYAIARWVRMPDSIRNPDARHAYTWAGSSLAAWMLWSELQPISVALGVAVFGLCLFELGAWLQQKHIRLQAYAVLTAAFIRIFFVNLTAATLPGEALSPRIYTVVPMALIYFFVWAQLQSDRAKPEIGRWSVSDLIAYFGTGCVAALLYFQTAAEWIVVAWAVLALVLMLTTLLLDKEVFLQQAALLVVGIVARGLAHNIFGGSYFLAEGWRGNFLVLSLASALLLGALPIAFRLRARYAAHPMDSQLSRYLALNRPEQMLFFAPVVLITFIIAVKMNPGMVTLSWGIESVMVILLGLLVSQRSYRITGLFLLLLCVAKIIFRDAWNLDERDRYITFIVLGAALTLVSTLYGKYRETVRRLL
jgi:hypothetical protein